MVGALIFLQKLRISPDDRFSVNDWTAFVIFITVIGGIGRIEGPIVGTLVFFPAARRRWPISAASICSCSAPWRSWSCCLRRRASGG